MYSVRRPALGASSAHYSGTPVGPRLSGRRALLLSDQGFALVLTMLVVGSFHIMANR